MEIQRGNPNYDYARNRQGNPYSKNRQSDIELTDSNLVDLFVKNHPAKHTSRRLGFVRVPRVRDVRPSRLKIKFPNAPSGVVMPGEKKQAPEESKTAEKEC